MTLATLSRPAAPVPAERHLTSYFQMPDATDSDPVGLGFDVLPLGASAARRGCPSPLDPHIGVRRLNNMIAVEGVDRCRCGAKYWENDTCVDCGERVVGHVAGFPVFA